VGQIWMKVPQTGPRTGPTHSRRVITGRSEAAGFSIHVKSSPAGAATISMPSPLAALGNVLAAQEVQEGSGKRQRAIQRGRGLLDELGQIRAGLLEGKVSDAALGRLSGLLRTARPAVGDAKLGAVLDEIELRAAVELAKRQQG
jgi:hypothetical protein